MAVLGRSTGPVWLLATAVVRASMLRGAVTLTRWVMVLLLAPPDPCWPVLPSLKLISSATSPAWLPALPYCRLLRKDVTAVMLVFAPKVAVSVPPAWLTTAPKDWTLKRSSALAPPARCTVKLAPGYCRTMTPLRDWISSASVKVTVASGNRKPVDPSPAANFGLTRPPVTLSTGAVLSGLAVTLTVVVPSTLSSAPPAPCAPVLPSLACQVIVTLAGGAASVLL